MQMIRKVWLLICFMALGYSVIGQIGARIKYNFNNFSDWNGFTNDRGQEIDFYPSNLEISLDYWFRLKNYRLEFTPELSYGLLSKTVNSVRSSNFTYFSFLFNTQIYAFDFAGDCDCPTFSKQGPSLNKSLFFNVSPGVLYSLINVTEGDDSLYDNQAFSVRLGLGLGYDIGINDLVTITPIVSYFLTNELTHRPISSILSGTLSDPPLQSSSLNQLQFQIRVGFRPDYVKSYGSGRRRR